MCYVMPLIEKRADGLVPSAQSLRVYECAGRRRTLANLEPTGDGTKICSAQNLKAFPAPLSCPAKATPKVFQEAVTFLFTMTKFMLSSFSGSPFPSSELSSDAMMWLPRLGSPCRYRKT